MISALNKITGTATPGMIMPVSVSPNTAADNETRRYVADKGAYAQIYGDDLRYKTDSERNNLLRNQHEYEQNNPTLEKHVDADGNVWMINPRTGNPELVRDKDGNPVKGEAGHYQLDVQMIKSLNDDYEALGKQLEDVRSITTKPYLYTPEQIQAAEQEAAEIKAEMITVRKKRDELYEKLHPQARPSPATPVIGQPPASADVPAQPSPQTASRDIPQVTALQDTQPAPQPTAQQNISDFSPQYIGQLLPVTKRQPESP